MSAAAAPGWRQRLAERLADWPNPLVVKEVRQAVNGRFTGAVLILLLALQLVILAFDVLVGDLDRFAERGMGRELFTALQATLLFAATLAMPLYTGVRAMVERSGNQLDLLYVTTLPPRQIVSGKLQAAALLTALVYVASTPLMCLCYLLRGIDVPSMAVVVTGSYLLVVNAIVLALAVACVPAGRVLRVVFAIVFFGVLMAVMTFATAATQWAISSGIGARFSTGWAPWQEALTVLGVDLLALRLVFLLNVAMVSPPSANRAPPVRRFLALVWVLTLGSATLAVFVTRGPGPLKAWLVLATWVAGPLLLAAGSGRDRPSAAVRREQPAGRLRRVLAFPFASGAANGFLFALFWQAATLGVGWLAATRLPPAMRVAASLPPALATLGAYLLGYAGTAAMLVRGRWRRWLPIHQAWVLALTLIAVGSTLPPIVGFLLDPSAVQHNHSFGPWLVLNPAAVFRDDTAVLAARVGLLWSALVLLGGARWWLRCAGVAAAPPPAGEPDASPA